MVQSQEASKHITHLKTQHLFYQSLSYDRGVSLHSKIVQSCMPVALRVILIFILTEPSLPESEEAEKQKRFEGNGAIHLSNVIQKVSLKKKKKK